jgi:hypothetical protein
MAASMRSARLHEPGQPLRIDTVEIPEPRPRDVLVRVKACGIIPNMNAIFSGRLWNHLPPLPASVGLDAAGVIAEVDFTPEPTATSVRSCLRQSVAFLRDVFVLLRGRADAVQRCCLPGLFRFFPPFDAPATGLSVWRFFGVHHCIPAAAGAFCRRE